MGDPLVGLTVVVVLGVACQLLAPVVRLPAILLLLLVGFGAGAADVVEPDALLGDLLFPVVSLSVGVILFEGGLTLDVRELRGGARTPVRRLLSVGVLVTWALTSALAVLLLGLPLELGVLLGAVLVVSGPTVVTPLLGFVGPVGRVGSVLKFEGILVDPVGAILAVLVFEGVLARASGEDAPGIVLAFALTVGTGLGVGAVGAVVLGLLLRVAPDRLDAVVTLAAVFAALAASDALRAESGLVAVTLMGGVLANQRRVDVRRVHQFEETLGLLLISVLFILLSARVTLDDVTSVGWPGLVFVALLVLAVRPLAVALATVRSGLAPREKALLAWLGPRGIVAASVASVFALQLAEAGVAGADRLVPYTFVVIVGTVLVASLTVVPVASALGLRRDDEEPVTPSAEPAPDRSA